MKNLLEDRDELLSNLRWGGCEDWQKSLSKPCFLILGYSFIVRSLLARFPSSCYAVLQVNNRCSSALVSGGRRGRKFAFFVLDRRTEASCSACSISKSASVKPGWSSA